MTRADSLTQVMARTGAEAITESGAGAPFEWSTVKRAFRAAEHEFFAVIEADTIEEAVALVAGTPCSIAHGLVEVWPLATAENGSSERSALT